MALAHLAGADEQDRSGETGERGAAVGAFGDELVELLRRHDRLNEL